MLALRPSSASLLLRVASSSGGGRRSRLASSCHRYVTAASRTLSTASDPWAILGVKPTDGEDVYKAAFRKLALALHPDVSKDAEDAARFAAVVEAYEAVMHDDAAGSTAQRRGGGGPRGMRVVGGILVVSIDALKRDPAYEVQTVRVRLEGDEARDAVAAGGILGADSDALSTEAVTEVCTSAFDSVADLRMQLEEELAVPEALKRGGRRRGDGGQHELIYRGQLLGEHLFLGDYDIKDGDLLHFAVHTGGRAAR